MARHLSAKGGGFYSASGYSTSSTATKYCSYTAPTPKCATPVITGEKNKNITITCSTPNATIYWKIKAGSGTVRQGSGASPQIIAANYTLLATGIEAYATASGYLQSNTAVKTF